MKNKNAVEFVSFKLKEGASVADFLLASDKINKDFLALQKGYISRQLLQKDDLWADYVLWETMDDALTAANVCGENASALEYFSFLDDKSVDMRHFTVEKEYPLQNGKNEIVVEIINKQPQIAVAMKKTAVSMEQIAEVTTEGYKKIMGYLAEQSTPESGAEIAGAPYLAYMNANEDFSKFDIELGIPVSEAVPAGGEFYMSQTYEGKAIATTYKGAYKDIEVAYVALMDYAKENSLEMTGVYYDYYISNPSETPESELLTQVVFPIK